MLARRGKCANIDEGKVVVEAHIINIHKAKRSEIVILGMMELAGAQLEVQRKNTERNYNRGGKQHLKNEVK
jgi:hypothetical protein